MTEAGVHSEATDHSSNFKMVIKKDETGPYDKAPNWGRQILTVLERSLQKLIGVTYL